MKKRVVVIGGGAAGFFAAIKIKQDRPELEVLLLEGTGKVLSKVKVSGGGRCNVTTSVVDVAELIKCYPRGGKRLRKLFHEFGPTEMVQWLKKRGVDLKTEPDGRMFPVTDDSMTIVNCLRDQASALGVQLVLNAKVVSMERGDGQWSISTTKEVLAAHAVVMTTGGVKNQTVLMPGLEQPFIQGVPSLFTFNIKDAALHALSGLSVAHAACRVQGSKLKTEGPLLVTHWGLSGPAVLKLSAFAARELAQRQYQFEVLVNWVNWSQDQAHEALTKLEGEKQLKNQPLSGIPQRLWLYLLERSGLRPDIKGAELGAKGKNRLVEVLTNCQFNVSGKTTFKEEFVTCGGVDLQGVDLKTMESKVHPQLYFAGELLDIDGITGGFNFQAAWTTAYIAGRSVAQSFSK